MSSAEVLSGTTNAAIVQLPGRSFPSICVQGDTLSTLATSVNDTAVYLLKHSADEDVLEWIIYANNVLVGLVGEYNRVALASGKFPSLEKPPDILDLPDL